jgi:4-amino-4-deoxy-L-arabinose transferase-like glycosyltransferase
VTVATAIGVSGNESVTNGANWTAAAFIALLVLLTRVPYFFDYLIDADESTYLLMGRSLLDGHLPYTQLWDGKPPLAFALVAAFMAGPGNDVVQLRLWGAVLVFISAVLVRAIVRRSVDRQLGTPAALLFVIGCAVTESGQATMMEYVALPFMLGALRMLVDAPVTVVRACLGGALVAAAAMVRLNLAFVAPFLGLALLALSWRAGAVPAIRVAVAFAVGGCVVVALVALPYLLQGDLELFVGSCLGAGMSHSAMQSSWSSMFTLPIERTFGFKRPPGLDNRSFMLALLVWFPAVLGAAYVGWRYRRTGSARRHAIVILGSATAGVALSILLAGIFYEHHTLQLLPFAAILAALAYRQLARVGVAGRIAVIVLAGFSAGMALKPLPYAWKGVIDRAQSGHLMAGPAVELVEYLGPRCADGCTVFLMVDHLGYWLLDKPLPTRVVHPSNIASPYVYTLPGMRSRSPEEEFAAIFASNPTYVVIRAATVRRPRVDDGYDIAQGFLQRNYRKVHEYGSGSRTVDIYERVERN